MLMPHSSHIATLQSAENARGCHFAANFARGGLRRQTNQNKNNPATLIEQHSTGKTETESAQSTSLRPLWKTHVETQFEANFQR